MPTDRIPEVVLSRVWNDGWHSREMRTTDGYRVGVVYRGVWTHSNGPDFRDAMLELDGRLIHGSVELHVRSSDWFAHQHHENPEYDRVVLHVVLDDDTGRTAHGPSLQPVPTVCIQPYLNGPIDQRIESIAPVALGDVGMRTCLPTLAGGRPDLVHAVLRREGWRRMHEKQLRFQQEMSIHPPGDVLYRALLDSLGFSANRQGMAAVANSVSLQLAERVARERGSAGAASVLLGVAGFLPLSPGHAALIGDSLNPADIEHEWERISVGAGLERVPLTIWNLNRVRPLNHPVRRLASMASLLSGASDDGLLAGLTNRPLDGGRAWDAWLADADPPIGRSRRGQIVVNAVAPFVAAHAELNGDNETIERIGETWEQITGGVDDDIARRTRRQIAGEQRLPIRLALEVQGLHQIGRHGCAHLRCFECPIAELAVRYESISSGLETE